MLLLVFMLYTSDIHMAINTQRVNCSQWHTAGVAGVEESISCARERALVCAHKHLAVLKTLCFHSLPCVPGEPEQGGMWHLLAESLERRHQHSLHAGTVILLQRENTD